MQIELLINPDFCTDHEPYKLCGCYLVAFNGRMSFSQKLRYKFNFKPENGESALFLNLGKILYKQDIGCSIVLAEKLLSRQIYLSRCACSVADDKSRLARSFSLPLRFAMTLIIRLLMMKLQICIRGAGTLQESWTDWMTQTIPQNG